ncbi:probable sensor histidine kinase TcrY [Actinomycetota bacterium]|jgi:two-component system OmpR family sensor kinase|nr:probable sensor histidine kinase TcrY [Actinomycetota bacterium]
MNSPLSRVRTPLSLWSLRNRLILASVVLASFAIIASDFAANAALRTYLISQVDDQLINISSTSLNRLDRAGIAPLEADDKNSPFKILEPLRGVPTATSITLLDIDGNLIGQVGGELGGKNFAVTGMKIDEVSQYKNRPFTIEGKDGQPDIRALAQMLPTGMGSVIVADSLEKVDKTLSQLRFLFLILGLIALITIAMAARWIIALGLKPLEAVEDTAEAIAAGDLSARLPAAKPDTEVGRLTTSLNTMLARIEESFTARVESENKLRRFVADASHELRTPLTAIRGFAELHRQGAVVGEEKTKELINRIEKESVRMSSLVEDLLLLARLDQSRELAKEPVDLNTLITEAVASARAAGPNHPIEIKLEASEIFVLGDSQRIHQVIANLLANARAHTPNGTEISITAMQGVSETTIAVSDKGPGLSKADQDRIFERFYRADPSRVRNSGEGSGLGLSIVDAVMKAHGGYVSVKSEVGQGATFTLHFLNQE